MTVADDLATLISPLSFTTQKMEAAKRVEAEIARLQRHPDAWSQQAFDQQKARAEAAEAEIAQLTDALRLGSGNAKALRRRAEAAEAEVERLERELANWRASCLVERENSTAHAKRALDNYARAEAAEAEIARLEKKYAKAAVHWRDQETRRRAAEDEIVRLGHKCVFPSCVDGEKPEWCGRCGDALRAEAAEAEAARLRDGLRPIVREYDLWSEDANDGEFRLWDLDRLVAAIVAARALLAEDGAAQGCAACDGDPEAHGLHVCGEEFGA